MTTVGRRLLLRTSISFRSKRIVSVSSPSCLRYHCLVQSVQLPVVVTVIVALLILVTVAQVDGPMVTVDPGPVTVRVVRAVVLHERVVSELSRNMKREEMQSYVEVTVAVEPLVIVRVLIDVMV
jgi:hypothetical protein